MKKIIRAFAVICSVFACVYLLEADINSGYELLWLLPATFLVCAPKILQVTFDTKNTLFFYGFVIVAFLRYVVSPVLMVVTGEYISALTKITISEYHIKTAIWLMAYELIICTLFFAFVPFADKKDKVQYLENKEFELPPRTGIYIIFFAVTAVATVMFPKALSFFSFGTIGMKEIELSELAIFEQITIMLLICTKFLAFTVILSSIKKCQDKYKSNILLDGLGLAITLIFSVIYYGGNRAQFIFSFVCSIYIYTLIFPKNKKVIYVISALIVIPIIMFMTEQRNYYDYYSGHNGVSKQLMSIHETISLYFGGHGNVAISVKMAQNNPGANTISQFFKDLFVPVVGLNKILPLGDGRITNALFNMTFFKTAERVSQILPSIGHGFFYFGMVGAPIIDIIQLIIVRELYKIQQRSDRIELIYLFNIVILRFSLMFGQNITQQINGLSMQLMVPLVVYYLNNKITVRSINQYEC